MGREVPGRAVPVKKIDLGRGVPGRDGLGRNDPEPLGRVDLFPNSGISIGSVDYHIRKVIKQTRRSKVLSKTNKQEMMENKLVQRFIKEVYFNETVRFHCN